MVYYDPKTSIFTVHIEAHSKQAVMIHTPISHNIKPTDQSDQAPVGCARTSLIHGSPPSNIQNPKNPLVPDTTRHP